jgi:two-component system sensor histidine kinase and response regulator WspE
MNPEPVERKSILYIEDDVVVLTAYRNRLQQAGFDVESAGDGIEAMRILAARTFDLIILDLMLPRFSGTEVLKLIRENPRLRAIPIVIFSSNLEAADTVVTDLADKILVKGHCSVEDVLQAVAEALAKGTA